MDIHSRRLPTRRSGLRATLFEATPLPSDTTKLVVEMFPGVFIGLTLPTRYLTWSDDKPREPRFNPQLRELFLSGKLSIEVER